MSAVCCLRTSCVLLCLTMQKIKVFTLCTQIWIYLFGKLWLLLLFVFLLGQVTFFVCIDRCWWHAMKGVIVMRKYDYISFFLLRAGFFSLHFSLLSLACVSVCLWKYFLCGAQSILLFLFLPFAYFQFFGSFF